MFAKFAIKVILDYEKLCYYHVFGEKLSNKN